MLYGREAQLTALADALTRVREGGSAALVLRGEPGAGKTALLGHAAAEAKDMTVLRAAGVQVEAELPYAALHQVLRPALSLVDELPAPQASAIRGALGLAATGPPERFAVGLATLSLLAELAETRPVLCLVDNAQWLDRESADALSFAARRLHADRVGMLFAVRDTGHDFRADGLDELPVPGLDEHAAAALLADSGLSPELRSRVIAETGGNPLALRELAKTASTRDVTGGPLPLPRRVQDAFAAEIAALDPGTRTLLLVAAAEDTGELGVVLRAAESLGVPASAADAAVEAELAEVGGTLLSFRHPLIRSAVYQTATIADRLAVHGALSEVLTGEADADRRAWHTAAAATGTDEDAAAQLAATAERAKARGGEAAAVTALVRAAALTADPETRAARLVAAAESAGDSGQGPRARELAEQAAVLTPDPHVHARVAELRGEAELLGGSITTAHRVMLTGARAVLATDPQRAAVMVMHVVESAWRTGDPERAAEAVGVIEGADLTGGHFTEGIAATRGLAALLAGRPAEGIDAIRRLVEMMRPLRGGLPGARQYAATLATAVGDHDVSAEIAQTLTDECRAAGMAGWLPTTLSTLGEARARLGQFTDARVAAAEGRRIAADTGQQRLVGYFQALDAWLDAVSGADPAPASADDALAFTLATRAWALAMADLGAGRFDAAADRWDAAIRGPERHTVMALMWTPDQVEAAVRADRAADVGAFETWALANGQPWALALLERCRALLADDPEPHYERALELHTRDRRVFDEARTALLYGEWLRRERQRSRARTHLRTALDTFAMLAAEPWAARARTELRATGATHATRAAEPDLWSKLTPQESQVVKLAATGATNRDIGAQLFLSPRTVGHHLYKAYPKLGVAGRAELGRLLG
ncbi:ATP-binding protein [Phytomonospora endophytica]|uniref:DNA-binding CsgD family transcriptional regulator n=1 Tax=Phytomonospora endophytica TaxID=714109 RepID=A0A841FV11_9ACTN|nr:LuxR family transcriptional regulator [Phytomonospora endophytica]MBB6037558.1 DNA-binding CsgD family transcriptional regulator [Phytomonospora endophytica]GIG70259.1 transcriptional regulator [Phytomonospora endophytica]